LITYSKVYCQVIGPWAIYIAPSKLSSTKEIHGASHDERALLLKNSLEDLTQLIMHFQ
jgi:hypothetical protein